ncbi:MAG: CAP domain-containing protein [Spirochaetota bacterium]|nr:CAP domain-containing protein [Spirochaetota bacterium]
MLKLKNLMEINKSRKKYGLSLLKLDIVASRVANKHCIEMLKYNYAGHWNKSGFKPYHRYAFAGETDHIGENLFAKWTTGSFNTNIKSVNKMMLEGHKSFMAEKFPNNWHKKMVLAQGHTHIGIGFAINKQSFRYSQMFVNRYVTLKPIPKIINSPFKLTLEGNIIKSKKNYGPYMLVIYYETIPSNHFNYKIQPKTYHDFTNSRFLTIPPWKMKYNDLTGNFMIDINFKDVKNGYYYIKLYVRKNVSSIPYVLKKRVSINNSNAVPATGIIIRVKN